MLRTNRLKRALAEGREVHGLLASLADYVEAANREILVVAMIESRQGVAEIEAICAVPGLDMLLEGAADLSQSLGVTWQTGHPDVIQALEAVQRTASEHDIPYCAFLRDAKAKARWRARGVRTFMLGDERGIAFRALQKALGDARSEARAPIESNGRAPEEIKARAPEDGESRTPVDSEASRL